MLKMQERTFFQENNNEYETVLEGIIDTRGTTTNYQ